MGHQRLCYLSEAKLGELRQHVSMHRERYAAGDFLDLQRDNGWAIEAAGVTVDHDRLAALDGTVRSAQADCEASRTLYRALPGMTPALAREERVWVRLTHVECLDYARDRWLSGQAGEGLDRQVLLHLFAGGLTGVRDDNALSRLWWNMHIATIADPDDPDGALGLILKTADIRSNFIERPATAARRPLARAVVRAMRRDPWITSNERAFRQFMIVLNRDGGGLLFEVMSDADADGVMNACADRARAHLQQETGDGRDAGSSSPLAARRFRDFLGRRRRRSGEREAR